MNRKLLFFILTALLSGILQANELIRIGTLKFGTVNWELDVIKHHQLDQQQNLSLEIIPFSNNQASKIAFQGDQVDMIVSDWVWVSRERHNEKLISFIPYSVALGAIMLPPDSTVKSFADLSGLRVGIAGGANDKSWLLLRAWSKKHHGFDPADLFDVQYAAPPLLNGLIQHHKLDAVLNFWHYCARLEARDYQRLLEMKDINQDLINSDTLPMIGYIFKESSVQGDMIERFNTALQQARKILINNPEEWERLRPLMKVNDDTTFQALRTRYIAGIPKHWADSERQNANELYAILANIGGKKLTGEYHSIAKGTFWNGVRF